MSGRTFKRVRCALYIASITAVPTTAWAQLTAIPGLNSPQSAAARAIQGSCPTLAANSTTLNSAQTDLLNVCTAMIFTSIARQSGTTNAFDLGISESALAGALQTIASEETIVQGSSIIEGTRGNLRALGARLTALRAGAGGLRISGLPGQTPTTLVTGAQGLVPKERGGGASTDIGGRLSGFVNVNGNWGKKDETAREDAFDFKNTGGLVGADYRFRDDLVGGIAVNFSRTEADTTSGGGGDTRNNTYGLSLYGTHYQGPWYFDANANYSRADFKTGRNVIIPSAAPGVLPPIFRVARGKTDGNQFSLGLGTGYKHTQGALTVTPYGRLDYIHLSIDGYTETGSTGLDLTVDGQKTTSLQTAVGAQVAYAISTASGVVVPQVSLEWNHEFRNRSRTVAARFVNDPFNLSNFAIPTNEPDRNFFTLGVGLSAVLTRGTSAFINYERVLGLSHVTANAIVGGVRMEF